MAYQCNIASSQYFNVAALNVTVPPVTLSMWINVASVVANKHSALYIWRGTINTGLLLRYAGATWELRYFVGGGNEWQLSTGLTVTTGAWQHACVAITSTQARLYLNGTLFTNNASHASATINAAGDVANDSIDTTTHTPFNGMIAEAAIWSEALSNDECLALSKRISPLALSNHLHSLVLFKDLVRDLNRGIGPALTAVNGPGVAAHPPLIYPSIGRRLVMPSGTAPPIQPPYRVASGLFDANRAVAGAAAITGASRWDFVQPAGVVSG